VLVRKLELLAVPLDQRPLSVNDLAVHRSLLYRETAAPPLDGIREQEDLMAQ
jgi:hypothetical protein